MAKMTIKQAVKNIIKARAYNGLANWHYDRGDLAGAEFYGNEADCIFAALPDDVYLKAMAKLEA
jgi:hypothetical protein